MLIINKPLINKNLLKEKIVADGSTTHYVYDAAGRKLRTEHKVMTTAAFHPEIDDAGDAGIAPEPADEGVEAGEGEVGEEWPQMPSFEELEELLGEELAEGEGMEAGEELPLPPMEPTAPSQPAPLIEPIDAPSIVLPYELTVTDYCGNFIYENGKLSRILFDGGFITFPDTTVNGKVIADITRPQYHYTFTDHLGSIRVVTDANGNVEQTNSYYPYGGLMASSSSIANPTSQANIAANQPNRYNGKELDRKNGLDWLDYGARHFAGHGHWTSPDPLSEKYYDWSPYVYCVGNPIKFVDPDGRKVVDSKGRNIYYIDNNGNLKYTRYASEYDKKLYQGMMLTKIGRSQLTNLVNTSTNIRIYYEDTYDGDKTVNKEGKVHFTYAITNQFGIGKDNGIYRTKNGCFKLREASIVFYIQTIKESLEDQDSPNYGYTEEEALGAIGSHEAVHASDEDEIHKDIYSDNGGPKRREDEYEKKAREVEKQYRKELKEKHEK